MPKSTRRVNTSRMVRPRTRYTRSSGYRNAREQSKYKQQMWKNIIISALFIALLWFVGLPILARLDDFWSLFRRDNNETEQITTDRVAPSQPYLSPPPVSTNQPSIGVSGTTESKAKVILLRDGREDQETYAQDDGKFNFQGINIGSSVNLSVIAVDDAGNKSQPSRSYTVTLNKDKPVLTILSPKEGAVIASKAERTITVDGSVMPEDSIVTINDSKAIVDEDGNFQFRFSLTDNGKNVITIKATDSAGNNTEQKINVTYEENNSED